MTSLSGSCTTKSRSAEAITEEMGIRKEKNKTYKGNKANYKPEKEMNEQNIWKL
jgi:hypothetical protein